MILAWPVPSGTIVVVGWMIVPLADRSTTGCGAGCGDGERAAKIQSRA
jgi:fumarylacetoacetate (FAA) hydrolase family protein